MSVVAVTTTNHGTIKGYIMNEITYTLPSTNGFYNQHSYIAVNFAALIKIFGYSFARLNPI